MEGKVMTREIKKQEIKGIKLLYTKVGIRIFKIYEKDGRGIYFCYERCFETGGSSFIRCVVVKCRSDEKVFEFCKKGNPMEVRSLQQMGNDLFVTTILYTNDEEALLEIVKTVEKGVSKKRDIP